MNSLGLVYRKAVLEVKQFERALEEKSLNESSIDFPRPVLAPEIWEKTSDGKYKLRKEAKEKIFSVLKMYPYIDIPKVAEEIHIIGSIGTNQYTDDADVDVHFILDQSKLPPGKSAEDWQKDIRKWYKDNVPEKDRMIGTHPIEIYYQLNPAQELLSDSFYNVTTDEWVKGPLIVELEFDPYEVYKHVYEMIKEFVKETDLQLGELKRDVIDYQVIKDAMKHLPSDVRKKLKEKLEAKLAEIEADINELLKTKKEWVDMRQNASKPLTLKQALDDIELIKKWKDTNALFKFVSRYQYLRVISELEKLLEDDEISDADVKLIQDLLGVIKTK